MENETEKRMGFRVPLSISSGLSASISFGEKTCSVRLLNLSLSGILVEFSEGEVYEMPIDTQIKIRFQLQDTTKSLAELCVVAVVPNMAFSFRTRSGATS